jgi:hypothetical protein
MPSSLHVRCEFRSYDLSGVNYGCVMEGDNQWIERFEFNIPNRGHWTIY